MPTYEYACRDCGEHLEVVQSFRDDPLTTCPNCEGTLRKVFSAAGIIFKGSGWHIKDYKDGGTKPAAASSDSSESSSSDTSSSGSTSTDGGSSDSGSSDTTSSDTGSSSTGDARSA